MTSSYRETPSETRSVEEVTGLEHDETLPVISDNLELLKRGICRVKLPVELDLKRWADELSQVTPMILGFEGDGEYAFYRNIAEEPEFPFDLILLGGIDHESSATEESKSSVEQTILPLCGLSEIGRSVLRHFPILPKESSKLREEEDWRTLLSEELQLDDAFCVHYNMNQDDTTGKKHMDPSDITVNMCLHKSKDAKGSYVLFHGTKQLRNADPESAKGTGDDDFSYRKLPLRTHDDDSRGAGGAEDDRFLVSQEPGYATIHFGDHPHETTSLRNGSRTNVILTYVYTDSNRSDVATRTCY